jgi:hypothetical protein
VTKSEVWSGVDVNLSARIRNGIFVQGGTSTGRTHTDSCAIRAKLPETAMLNPFCNVKTPWTTQLKLVGAYTVPKVDAQLSATFQNLPGPASARPTSHRTRSSPPRSDGRCPPARPTPPSTLIAPAATYAKRFSQLDLRFGKAGAVRGLQDDDQPGRVQRAEQQRRAVAEQRVRRHHPWLTPQSIMQARLLKISGVFDF